MSTSEGQLVDFNTEEQLLLSVRAESKAKVNSDKIDNISVNNVGTDSIQEQTESQL